MIPVIETKHRLRLAREAAGFKSAALAVELGVQRQTISNYENGHTRPDMRTMRAWSHVTDVPLWWIMGKSAPTGELLQLDSNQQPLGYRTTPAISSLDDKRRAVGKARTGHTIRDAA